MSTLQLALFGLTWVLAALLLGSFIIGLLFKNTKQHKAGLTLIVVSYFLGLAMLGVAITYA